MKLLNYDHDRYHADDVGLEAPTLNSGIAQMLIDPECTPKHAWQAHPKLGRMVATEDEGDEESADTGKTVFDIGHAIHRAILGRGSEYVLCDFKDWRTKAAQTARAEIRGEGKTPLLKKHYDAIQPIADTVRSYLARNGIPPMDEWETEVVYIGQTHHGDPTRCMVDAWHPASRTRMDLKSAACLSDRHIQKAVYEGGYAFQDEFYQRVMECNGDRAARRLILFIDKRAPFCHRLVEVDAFGRSIVAKMVSNAELIWNNSLRYGFNEWPDAVHETTPPDWWVKAQGEYL